MTRRKRCRHRIPDTPIMYRYNACCLLVLFLGFTDTSHSWLPPTRRAPYKFMRRHLETPLDDLILLHAKKRNRSEDNNNDSASNRISLSNKDKTISALSQPAKKEQKDAPALPKNKPEGERAKSSKRTTMKRSTKETKNSSLLPPPESKKRSKTKKAKRSSDKDSSFSSLLPPPLPRTQESESLSSGLSSWEEFLGRSETDTPLSSNDDDKRLLPRSHKSQSKQTKQQQLRDEDDNLQLPSISDLFPPDVTKKESSESNKFTSGQSIDGVLPVSELFYRSSQAITGEDKEKPDADSSLTGDEGDDEELPFSAEQTDKLTSDGNKVKIRTNRAETTTRLETIDESKTKKSAKKKTKPSGNRKRKRGRKLVRRGMEMFLAGTPINADPPQRSIELTYKAPNEDDPYGWARAITVNTPDFGPLLQTGKAESVTPVEIGLFCENFVSAAMKWDVCPKDLREIVKGYTLQQESPSESSFSGEKAGSAATNATSSISVEFSRGETEPDSGLEEGIVEMEVEKILSMLSDQQRISSRKKKKKMKRTAAKGFGKKSNKGHGQKHVEQRWRIAGFALMFCIGVSKEELESGDSRDAAGSVMRRVLTRGITTFLKTMLDGMVVRINTLKLHEDDDGGTTIAIEFSLEGKGDATQEDIENLAAPIDTALEEAATNGDFALALAAAAKEETAWPEAIRDRVVEEILLDEDVHAPWEATNSKNVNGAPAMESLSRQAQSETRPSVISDGSSDAGARKYEEDDIFGHEGVFFDYSEANAANAPFKGRLGPLLLDAVTAKAVERPPRIIAIGDVHGCIEELQDLLRLCDYRPGDQIVFLGDLVSKGPDSISVVQMAREIGAIGVRGNHDFEVIRWHQAIKADVDPPVVGSEHFHIASYLSAADMRWMFCQPWYMASKELGALFVHAGFVSGIRLSKQNPRLMMNMRSILPDGTVTSKFFNNWPWARLWDGPQTVLFGHDADRGLQQYEHAIGLDTGCVYGGRLTACMLPEKRLVSVSARREYFKYRRKHYD